MFKRLLIVLLTFVAVACGVPPLEPAENTAVSQQHLYSHTPGTTKLYTSAPGAITGQSVRFALWLPPQYNGVTPVPWILWLHGKQLTTAIPDQVITQQANQVVPSLSAAIAAGKIEPVAIAFPWGGWESWYNDSCSTPDWPIETMLVQELIPDIEANVATYGDRAHRVIAGFSMGGHGALKLGAKNPNLFVGVLSGAAPKPDPNAVQWPANELDGYEAAFCSLPANFAASAPLTQYQANTAAILSLPLPTRMIVGGADGTRFALATFKNKLVNNLGLGAVVQYQEVPGVAHTLGPLLQGDGGTSWKFVGDLIP